MESLSCLQKLREKWWEAHRLLREVDIQNMCVLGIGIKDGYRDIGIGTEMMKNLSIKQKIQLLK